jgi:hypothetical protein
VTRLVIFAVAALSVAEGSAATYRGRVEYAATGKRAAHIIVEARSRSGPNLLFWIPRVMHEAVDSTTTRSDGTFTFQLPDGITRLRFAARGIFYVGRNPHWDAEIIPRAGAPNIIRLPEGFRPWHPPK